MENNISNTNTTLLKLLAGLALVIVLFLLNLAWGSIHIPFKGVLNVLFYSDSPNVVWSNILIRTRLPQSLVALAAGCALSISGLLMQTLFRNPLAGPSVLGISSGASLGVGFVVLIAGNLFGYSLSSVGLVGDMAVLFAAFAGAMGILFIILMVARHVGGTLSVLIVGVMIGYLSNSIVSIMKFYSLEEDIHSYVIWGLGNFGKLSLDRANYFLLFILAVSLLSLFLGKWLNMLSLGDNYARNLGLRIERSRFLIIMLSGVLTATVTAFCGPIIFIGMAVPHLAKMVSKTSNHYILILNSAILGSATALLCNLIARLPGFDGALPINSVTAFVGAPVVISVIWRRRRDQLSV